MKNNAAVQRRKGAEVFLPSSFTFHPSSFLLLAALFLPVLWAVLFPPEGWSFYRAWALGGDYTQYRSAMAQGAEGAWLIVNRFTPEPHAPALQYPGSVALGHGARWLHLPLEALYTGASIATGVALLWGLGVFAATFLPETRAQRTAWLLTLAVGPGWLAALIQAFLPACAWCGRYNSAFNRPEVNTALLLVAPPHLPLSLAGLLWLWADFWRRREAGYPAATLARYAALAAALGLLNPFCLAPALLPLGVWWLAASTATRKPLWSMALPLAALGLAALPLLLYNYTTFTLDPFWGMAYGSQNFQASLPLDGVIWGYGFATLLAGWAVWRYWRGRSEGRFLLTLALVLLTTSYLPVTYQRRFGFGLGPLLAVLAAPAWQWAAQARGLRRIRRGMLGRVLWSVLLIMLVWGQNLAYYAAYTAAHADAGPTPRFVFQPRALAAAATYLDGLDEAVIVLCYEDTGNILAGELRGRVVLGHSGATLDVARRRAQVAAFLGGQLSAAEQDALLAQWGVTHIVISPETDDAPFAASPCWPVVFAVGDMTVYAVLP